MVYQWFFALMPILTWYHSCNWLITNFKQFTRWLFLTSTGTQWAEWSCTWNCCMKLPTYIVKITHKFTFIVTKTSIWSTKDADPILHKHVYWIIFLSDYYCITKSTKFVSHIEVPCVWFKVMKVNRYGLIEFCGFGKTHPQQVREYVF